MVRSNKAGSRPPREKPVAASGPEAIPDQSLAGLAPDGVVVDENLEILEFFGHAGRFLHLPSGAPRLNLLLMAPAAVAAWVVSAIKTLRKGGGQLSSGAVRTKTNESAPTVMIEVARDPGSAPGLPRFRVGLSQIDGARLPAEILAKGNAHAGRAKQASAALLDGRQTSNSAWRMDGEAERASAFRDLEGAHARLELTNEELVALNEDLEDSNRRLVIALEERDRAEARRRGLEERLLQKQKLESLGVMAGGVAHDFNNILTSIVGHSELLIEGLPPESPERAFAEEIEKAGLRAASLVKQMLAYSGSGNFDLAPVDLGAVVLDVAGLIHSSLPAGVRLEHRIDEDLPRVEADASQIQQVVVNLVANAAESIESEGFISVCLRRAAQDELKHAQIRFGNAAQTAGYLCLQVSDTGCGMSEETKSRIFDPFFTTKESGHGLGLAAVLGIVRGHRGEIEVESRPGVGSILRIFLPIPPSSRPSGQAITAETEPRLSGTVVVVDDQAEVRAAASALLKSAGLGVATAGSGAAALEAIHRLSGQVTAVLLDLTMPEMDGRRVLQQLRLFWPQLPVVISSGHDRRGVRLELADYRNVSFLQKPYKSAQLLAKLREAIADRRDDEANPGGATIRDSP